MMRIDCTREELERMFDEHIPPSVEILFCALWSGGYEESIQVIYRQDGELYEVSAGHCSCNDFSGAWGGTRVTPAYLRTAKHYDASDAEWAELLAYVDTQPSEPNR